MSILKKIWARLCKRRDEGKADEYHVGVDLSTGPDRSAAVFMREVDGCIEVVHECGPRPGQLAAGVRGYWLLRSHVCPFCGEQIIAG